MNISNKLDSDSGDTYVHCLSCPLPFGQIPFIFLDKLRYLYSVFVFFLRHFWPKPFLFVVFSTVTYYKTRFHLEIDSGMTEMLDGIIY